MLQTLPIQPVIEPMRCLHCLTPIEQSSRFCCHGCAKAYELIHKLGLNQFYKLNQKFRQNHDFVPYDKVIDEIIATPKFCSQRGSSCAKDLSFRFSIDGLQCYACVWLLTHAIRKLDPAACLTINFGNQSAELVIPINADPRPFLNMILELGYPLRTFSSEALTDDERTQMINLGIAWFCTLNVMTLALAEYFATEKLDLELLAMFRAASGLFTILSLSTAGLSFFRSAWRNVQQGKFHIDIPIALALAIGFASSVWQALGQTGEVYFDSITAIIALIYSGRLFQTRMLRRAERKIAHESQGSMDPWLRVHRDQVWQMTRTSSLKVDEVFALRPHEVCPVDAQCQSQATITLEPLTGEPESMEVSSGDTLPSGALNGHKLMLLKAKENAQDSRLRRLFDLRQRLLNSGGELTTTADRLGKTFAISVPILAFVILVVTGWSNATTGVSRMVAFLLTACPCAFGLSIPMIFGQATARGLAHGITLRSQSGLENLAHASHMIFDKTGTLTEGSMQVVAATWLIDANDTRRSLIMNRLAAVSDASAHPASEAIARWAKSHGGELGFDPAMNASEEPGVGVTFTAGGHSISIKKSLFATGSSGSRICLDDCPIVDIEFDDTPRPESQDVIKRLHDSGLTLSILSGDHTDRTNAVAHKLGINAFCGNLSPEDKAQMLDKQRASSRGIAYVGNGFNDMLAMAKADVAIATHDAPAGIQGQAAIVLNSGSLDTILLARQLAKRVITRSKLCFGFACLYNGTFGLLAALGYIGPLEAAILMPINSLIQVIISLGGKEVS